VASKRVALLDWDGTLSSGAVTFSWTKFLHDRGLMSDAGMNAVRSGYADYGAGLTDYLTMVDVVTEGYAEGLRGRHLAELSALAPEFAQAYKDQILWFAPELIRELRSAGIETVVITGSPQVAVKALAQTLGVDRVIGLMPITHGGVYTGELYQNTARPEVKKAIVASFANSEVVLAGGDSVGDTPMLEASRVRVFVGNGQPPQLAGIVRLPIAPTPQAQRDLAAAIQMAKQISGPPPQALE
jgi:HAD superfamily phosphoserine phosphatase-like hydrolase